MSFFKRCTIIICCFNIIQPDFAKSQKTELKQYFLNDSGCQYLPLDQAYTNFKNYWSNLCKITYKNPENVTTAQKLNILKQAFNKLKELMNIPDEVTLEYADLECLAFYNHPFREIVITDRFLKQKPSAQLFLLLHELTHCLQHMYYGIHRYIIELSYNQYSIERYAETNAAHCIQCPLCLSKTKETLYRDKNLQNEGYFGENDFNEWICKKSLTNICNGCKTNSQNLNDYISTIPVTHFLLNDSVVVPR